MAKRTFSKFRSRWWAFCKIERQLKAHLACNTQSLAADLQVDARTVRRYIEFMRDDLGAPIIFDRPSQSYKFSHTTWSMPNVHLSLEELQSLAVAVKSITPTVPAPFAQPLESLLAKLLDALPEDDQMEIRRAQKQIVFLPVPVSSKGSAWVGPLLEAIRGEWTVDMVYFALSRNQETQRRFDPYHLRYFMGTWYVVGYDHLTKHWPVLNLARIRKLTVTEDFYRVRSFDPDIFFKNSFGISVGGTPQKVSIKLTGWNAKTAGERIWPPGFTYKDVGPDEGILTGLIANPADLELWIASCQGDAEMIAEEKSTRRAGAQDG
ncbi:MAG: WYL domain-containing protein [Phycisphaerae bacterium]|nr:WYL domain-containing protein [Phycisphaerae bacterium]